MVQAVIGLTALAVLIAAVALAVVAGTSAGTRWLVERGLDLSAAPVEVSGLDGTLLRGGSVQSVRITVGDSVVAIHDLQWSADWSASLLRDALVFEDLAAARVEITSKATAPSTQPLEFSLPLPPLPIAVDSLRIGRLELPGVATEFAPTITTQLTFDQRGVAVRAADVDAPAFHVRGDLALAPGADLPVTGTLQWQWRDPDASGEMTVAHSLRELTIGGAMRLPLSARLGGRVELLGQVEPRFDLRLEVPQLASAAALVHDIQVSATGVLDQFDSTATATVTITDAPEIAVAASAKGSTRALDITALKLSSVNGDASGRGHFDLTPTTDLVLALELENFDPVVLDRRLTGVLNGPVDLHWGGDRLELNVRGVGGTVNDTAFAGRGMATLAGGIWSGRDIHIASGNNVAVLDFEWNDEQIEASGRLAMPELHTLLPEMHGDLTGTFDVHGPLPRPAIDAQLKVTTLEYGDLRLRDANLQARLQQGFVGTLALRVAAIEGYGAAATDVGIDARGDPEGLRGQIGWTMHDHRGRVDVAARENTGTWQLDIPAGAELALPAELWRLDRKLSVTLGRDTVMLSAHCWNRGNDGGRICVDAAQWRGADVRLAGSIDTVPAQVLNSYVADLPELAGSVSGRWDLTAQQHRWRGTVSVASAGLGFVDRGDVEDVQHIELPSVSLHAVIDNDRVTLDASARHENVDVIALHATLDGLSADARLAGTGKFQVADVAGLATLSRRIGTIEGGISGNLTVAGTLAQPTVTGELTMQGGKLVMADPHVELTALDLTILLVDPTRLTFHGKAASGKGHLQLSGEMRNPLTAERELDAHLDAEQVPVHVTDADVRVGGQIDLQWRNNLVAVKGRVDIPRAEIKIAELPKGVVAFSDDVVVVDREQSHVGTTRLRVDLVVVLHDDVKLDAFGLKTRLDGQLRLRQSTEGVVQFNGTVTLVDGTFTAYDQTLQIESGRLVYSGPPDNPYVDVRATRTIQEPDRVVVVGAHVQGPARNIETTLFSDPEMSEAQTLSYLVLGRPLDTANPSQGSDMTGAAVALGLKGAAPVIDEIRSVTGIDTLTATGGTAEDLALIAGKHINDKLFVRYSYQTFTRTGALLIDLLLNRNWSVEATASQTPAVDVIYKVGAYD